MKRKTTTNVRVKDAEQGIVEAVIATLGVKDKDGDVAFKSSFTDGAPVVISAYGHTSWKGALPYGHAVLKVSDTEAVIEAQFLMDTTHGRDAFLTVKALGEVGLQEWSYSLHDVKAHRGEHNGEKVNFLDTIRVKEASPVLEGAGINTRNLATKDSDPKQLDSDLRRQLRAAGVDRWGDDDTWVYVVDFDIDDLFAVYEVYSADAERYVQVDFSRDGDTITLGSVETDVQQVTSYAPKGASFSEHTTAVLASVEALTARASEVVALRAEKGKTISESSAGLLKQLEDRLAALKGVIAEPNPITPTSDELGDLMKARLQHVARSNGVTTP